jgi:hypothetical protein
VPAGTTKGLSGRPLETFGGTNQQFQQFQPFVWKASALFALKPLIRIQNPFTKIPFMVPKKNKTPLHFFRLCDQKTPPILHDAKKGI